ncbi:hypothetical protein SHIRM173S_10204 [Streptomyces hirsutus]
MLPCTTALPKLPKPRSSATTLSARAPAAIEQAEPTSPWQPTSAPEIEAFSLKRRPIAPAARRKRTTLSSFSVSVHPWEAKFM